jgi:hypothetical protein
VHLLSVRIESYEEEDPAQLRPFVRPSTIIIISPTLPLEMHDPLSSSFSSHHPNLANHPHPSRLSASPNYRRPSALLRQYTNDGLLDPSRSNVVTPEGSEGASDVGGVEASEGGSEAMLMEDVGAGGSSGGGGGGGTSGTTTASSSGGAGGGSVYSRGGESREQHQQQHHQQQQPYAPQDGPGLPGYGRRGTVSKKPRGLRLAVNPATWFSSSPNSPSSSYKRLPNGNGDGYSYAYDAEERVGVGYLGNDRMEGGVVGNNSRTSYKSREELGRTNGGHSAGGYRDEDEEEESEEGETLGIVIERPCVGFFLLALLPIPSTTATVAANHY